MAVIGNKKPRKTPQISTSSLPDIIFILLFFFMVATVLKDETLKVQVRLPQATEITKMKDRQTVKYIFIGEPTGPYQSRYGTSPVIQLNDAIADVDDIGTFVQSSRAELPEDKKSFLKIAIKMDREAKIGILTDVKQELRKADALYLNYTTQKRTEIY